MLEKYSINDQVSALQAKSVAKATKVRQERAKRKIEDTINLLRLEGRNISEYAIAKESGCSINTVKKYWEFTYALFTINGGVCGMGAQF